MKDTNPEMEKKQLEIFLAMSESERFRIGDELNLFGRKVLESSIQQKDPGISEIELKIEIFKRYYSEFFPPSDLEKILRSYLKYLQESGK